MTIAQAFNEIAVTQGGTASTSGTIAGAIDALNDALAGSDQAQGRTIEDAVRLLGAHIGGGSSVTVESLTATENKTYTAPEGKAYSPVIVNVPAAKHSITYLDIATSEPIAACLSDEVEWHDYGGDSYDWVADGAFVSEALPGSILALSIDSERSIADVNDADGRSLPMSNVNLVMPNFDIVVYFY